MTKGLEKRRFQRLDYPLEVTIEIIRGEEAPVVLPPVQVKSRNISRGGICLESGVLEIQGINLLAGAPLARKNSVRLKIELLPAEAPFYATGEVRWYDVARDTVELTYHLGVEFLEFKDRGEDQLLRFLRARQAK